MFWRTALIALLALLNLALLGKVIWGNTGFLEYRYLKAQLADLSAEISQLDAENLALSREIRLLQTDRDYVEKMVRQRLHFLRDNEIVYIFARSADKAPGEKANDRKN